jgi:prepilin-type N-terminal cleavage/methylation domain-containing protein
MTDQRGFTLIEVLLAAFLITIGLVGLLSVVPVGTFATTDGYRLSTATFLANQKLEEVRNMPWRSAPANDCLGISANASAAPTVPAGATCSLSTSPPTLINAGGALPWFADQAANTMSGFPAYARNVRITDCGVAPGCGTPAVIDATVRNVVVTVTYRAGSAVAMNSTDKPVTVTMMVSQR